jgi:hypothetical protein
MSLRLELCAIAVAALLASLAGCGRSDVVAEGVIYRVAYSIEDGKIGGFTRANIARAVPGGNGSWNVDAYGKLTRDFLFITMPSQQRETGPEIIPVHRLVSIQFGDGGIKTVDKNPKAPD